MSKGSKIFRQKWSGGPHFRGSKYIITGHLNTTINVEKVLFLRSPGLFTFCCISLLQDDMDALLGAHLLSKAILPLL